MGKFRRGYSHAHEEERRRETERASWGRKLYEFYLSGDGDEADVVFLNEEPVECFVHNRVAHRNGRQVFDTVVCTRGDDCPDCEGGEKATYKGAYLVLDTRPYEGKDQNGRRRTLPYTLRFYLPGIRVVSALERISSKYGLLNRAVTIARSGKGTQTSYHVDRTDDMWSLNVEEMRELMRSDEMKALYNGDPDDIYAIIEQQLDLRLSTCDEEAENGKEGRDSRSDIVGRGGARDSEAAAPPKKKSPFKSRAQAAVAEKDDDLPF